MKDRDTSGALPARALWFAAPRRVEVRRETAPPPGRGEVRLRSIASAISHGTEMLVYRGEVSPDLPLDLPTLAGGYGFPIKYGYATVGRVLDVGEGVEQLGPGDHVFVHHPHQDVLTVPADFPTRLSGDIDPLRGLFYANLETALNVVHDTSVRLGETALVFGQGVVGALVTQLLGLSGARVLAVDPLERRRDLARKLGAELQFEPGEGLRERIFEETAGRGADVAIEVSGSGAALQTAIDCVAVEGTVVVASWYGTKPVTLDLGGRFHRGRVRVRSSQVGMVSPALGPRWDRGRRAETVLRLLTRVNADGLISHRFPLEEASLAYRLVDSRPGETMQVVLIY